MNKRTFVPCFELEKSEKMKINHPKFKELINYLEELGSAALAYSGGTDSTFLMAAAKIAMSTSLKN